MSVAQVSAVHRPLIEEEFEWRSADWLIASEG